MNRAKLKISMIKSYISRNEIGKNRLESLYKKQSVNDKLNQNKYTYEA